MNLTEVLKNGGIAVMPTDTIFGIVGRADLAGTVEKIYHIKGRRPDKPCIILIGDISDVKRFSCEPSIAQQKLLQKYWPGRVSVILSCSDKNLYYLHRGTNSLAFRLPDDTALQSLIHSTGPLLAPSANPESLPPATNSSEARAYFGDSVDIYTDGLSHSNASKLIDIRGKKPVILRP